MTRVQNFEDQLKLLDEINHLKEELQKIVIRRVSRDKTSKDSSKGYKF